MFKIKSISKYFFSTFNLSLDKLRNSYFKTSFYNQKISKEIPSKYIYKQNSSRKYNITRSKPRNNISYGGRGIPTPINARC